MQKEQNDTASIEVIHRRIMGIRGDRVMLDLHLAALYGVETRQLKRAVRRNIHRFPPDFMFELTREEYNSLRSQIGTIKRGEHSKYLPMAFTEQGVAMLSGVLTSPRAIKVFMRRFPLAFFAPLREIRLPPYDLLFIWERIRIL